LTHRFPQTFDRITTFRFHLSFCLALVPVVLASAYWQGWRVLVLTLLSLAGAWVSDEILRYLRKSSRPRDLEASLWGLLLALLLPAQAPFYLPLAGSAFAVLIVKGLLGGGGTPWINPVLASWALLQTNWPQLFPSGPFALADHHTLADQQVTDWLNTNIFSWLSIQLPSGYLDLFLGSAHPASALIVESGSLVLLAATVYLLAKGYFPWEIPTAFFLAFCLPLVVTGGNVLLQVFSGGFLLNLFFLASDPSSRPLGRWGLVIYGAGAGGLTFLVRSWGVASDGVGYAVLFMNLLVPWLDRRLRRTVLNDFRPA
jgi:electron transport complex protein RnfD